MFDGQVESSNEKCVTCNRSSIESSRYSHSNNKSFQCSTKEGNIRKGLRCSICKVSFICDECIHLFHEYFSKKYKKKRPHPISVPLLQSLNTYVKSNGTKDQTNYIGHCCIIKELYIMENNQKKSTIPIRHMKVSNNTNIRLGGSFVYEEYKLIMPTSFKFYDCMALAPEKELDGVTHFVLDEMKSLGTNFLGCVIGKFLPHNWNLKFSVVKVNLPYNKRKNIHVSTLIVFYSHLHF